MTVHNLPRIQPRIQIVSHGPACFDGVTAAAAIARFYYDLEVIPTFAANQDSDRVLQGLALRDPGDEFWITDLSWDEVPTGGHLRRLVAAGARVFWIDHHRSAIRRLGGPEFEVPFAGKLVSEEFSAARLVFEFLSRRPQAGDDGRMAHLKDFLDVILMADDHDRWVHRVAGSESWALAVQTLGAVESFNEMLKVSGATMTPALSQAYNSGRRAMELSMELANRTVAERQLEDGLKLVTACCFGYSSEVAANLYHDRHQTIVALLDMRSGGVSLRRSADCQTDLSLIASALGGGGHAAASGFLLGQAKEALAQELSRVLGDCISRTLQQQSKPAGSA